jgi:predicted XRE-type DNA-binding protein
MGWDAPARCGAVGKWKLIMASQISHEVSTSNVFEDIGLADAGEHLVKAKLVLKIDVLMRGRGLKQVEAAALLGVTQPDISKMLRGDFRQFSVERLMRFLVALGQDVEIAVRPHESRSTAATLQVA